jgi:hypothetical protein
MTLCQLVRLIPADPIKQRLIRMGSMIGPKTTRRSLKKVWRGGG